MNEAWRQKISKADRKALGAQQQEALRAERAGDPRAESLMKAYAEAVAAALIKVARANGGSLDLGNGIIMQVPPLQRTP